MKEACADVVLTFIFFKQNVTIKTMSRKQAKVKKIVQGQDGRTCYELF